MPCQGCLYGGYAIIGAVELRIAIGKLKRRLARLVPIGSGALGIHAVGLVRRPRLLRAADVARLGRRPSLALALRAVRAALGVCLWRLHARARVGRRGRDDRGRGGVRNGRVPVRLVRRVHSRVEWEVRGHRMRAAIRGSFTVGLDVMCGRREGRRWIVVWIVGLMRRRDIRCGRGARFCFSRDAVSCCWDGCRKQPHESCQHMSSRAHRLQ
jgi:hypothetical protein